MANYATTTYKIEGPTPILQNLHNMLESLRNGDIKPSQDYPEDWEGTVIHLLGGSIKGYSMRGTITDSNFNDGVLTIYAEEAWSVTDFRHALTDVYPDLTVYFRTEECGCDVFISNDVDGKYFSEDCLLDACFDGDGYSEYFATYEDACQYLLERTGFSDPDKYNELNPDGDSFAYIHTFEFSTEF